MKNLMTFRYVLSHIYKVHEAFVLPHQYILASFKFESFL